MRKIAVLCLSLCLSLGLSVPVNATENAMSENTVTESTAPVTPETPEERAGKELMASLWEADIETLRKALDTGLLTSKALTAYYMERIAAYNSIYNCFITICDNVWEEAEKSTTIGSRKILKIDPCETDEIKIRITSSRNIPNIEWIKIY